MQTELYINHSKVDLSPDTQITLNFNSNIFGDITKIRHSWTQTIHLPKTQKNRQILDIPDIVSYEGNIIRKYAHARLLRNGLEIFTGKAILLAVSGTYETALFWGETAALLNLLQSENETTINTYLDDDTTVEWGSGGTAIFQQNYAKYRYNNGVSATERQVFPSVQVFHILAKIAQRSGLNFVFADEIKNYLKTLYIPCTSMKYLTRGKTYVNTINGGGGSFLSAFGGEWVRNINIAKTGKFLDGTVEKTTLIVTAVKSVSIKYNGGILKSIEYFDVSSGSKVEYNNGVFTGSDSYEILVTYRTDEPPGSHPEWGTFTVSITENTGTEITLPYPTTQYPVYYNLPKINLTNFIKGVCHITGLYATRQPSDPPEMVHFISIADLYANRINAFNWSDRLTQTNSITYSYLPAQNNALKYTTAETVSIVADGVITEQNETLPLKADLLTLPFAATDNRTDGSGKPVAYLQQFTKEADSTEYGFNELQPRILRLVSMPAILPLVSDAYLTFAGLSFGELIPQFYTEYQRMVKKPVVIECMFNLNDLDLKDLDFSKPVYIRQLGKFYALITIQNTGKTCKTKMIQL